MSKRKQFKEAWAEFRQALRDLKIYHDVAEHAIKARMDKMTIEEWQSPMDDELAMWHRIVERMGGIRRMRIYHYALRKYGKLKKNERRRKNI